MKAGEILGADGLARIAALANVKAKGYLLRSTGTDIPNEFSALRPQSVTIAEGNMQATLYQRGDVYVFLNVDTSPENQVVNLFTNAHGRQERIELWVNDRNAQTLVSPVNRIVTLTEYGTRSGAIDWIALPNELRIVERSYHTGRADKLRLSIQLSASAQNDIIAAIKRITPQTRGHLILNESVIDGIALDVRFTPDGAIGDDDIRIQNIWCSELDPLVEAIEAVVPANEKPTFKTRLKAMEIRTSRPSKAYTWAQTIPWERGHIPWWCLWLRFL